MTKRYDKHDIQRLSSKRKDPERDMDTDRPFNLYIKNRFLMLLIYNRLYITSGSANLRKTYRSRITIYYMSTRNRTPSNIFGYGLYLYFLGLSFGITAKALSFLKIIKISHVSIWKWIQKYNLRKYLKNKEIKEYIIYETAIKSGSDLIWLWVIIEPKHKEILDVDISKKRNMFVTERVLSRAVNKYGLHSVSSDGGPGTHKLASFGPIHHLHSSFEKSIIERTMQYIKDRTESFDDYFPCKRNKCNLHHVNQWLKLSVYEDNKEIIS